ncbi:hypothetical protein [Candidatus Clostridium radicumherbarum]|uniref:Uncharacterized protein n=1 Tax=Candidatus Clostridium radicumherbarum TaxID=3381662 RepID=A0ABW8TNG6_9CLOT
MKILATPIDMVCWFEKSGLPHPVRFKLLADDESQVVIKVDKVKFIDKEKIAGNEMLIFKCESVFGNQQKIFELKYELRTCKWILWKI